MCKWVILHNFGYKFIYATVYLEICLNIVVDDDDDDDDDNF